MDPMVSEPLAIGRHPPADRAGVRIGEEAYRRRCRRSIALRQSPLDRCAARFRFVTKPSTSPEGRSGRVPREPLEPMPHGVAVARSIGLTEVRSRTVQSIQSSVAVRPPSQRGWVLATSASPPPEIALALS